MAETGRTSRRTWWSQASSDHLRIVERPGPRLYSVKAGTKMFQDRNTGLVVNHLASLRSWVFRFISRHVPPRNPKSR